MPLLPAQPAAGSELWVTLVLAALVLLCWPGAASSAYPPETTLGYGRPPELPRPGYLDPITDPVFGTRVERITRLRPLRPRNGAVRHVYSKIQPWNTDGTLLLTGSAYPRLLLDGSTYELLDVYEGRGEVWSSLDPSRLYGTHGRSFGYATVVPGAEPSWVTLAKFKRLRELSIGYGEGNLSNDDRYAVLIGTRPSGREQLLVYDIAAGEVTARRGLRRGIDHATMSQSGEWVLLGWGRSGGGRNRGVEVFDRELRFLRQLTRNTAHGDVGYTADGREAWVSYSGDRRRTLGAYPLAGGEPIDVIDADPGTWGGHVSCRNTARPGWCYISDAGHSPRLWRGYDQVWAQRIETAGVVQVFAHEHHTYEAGYLHQPQAVPSRDGSRVLWASDWDRGPRAPVFDYVAGMP